MTVTTIVLADDHPVVRHGLRTLLEKEPDFRVVGEASDGLEAVQLVERLQPNVAVVDLMMPGLNGAEVTRQIARISPATRVLVLSMYDSEGYVVDAMRSGATGYVLKGSSAHELVRAVREVSSGRRYLSPALSERAIEVYLQRAESQTLDPYDTLTTREREVLQLVAEGSSNASIATRLQVSPRTVETHRANLMRKLGLRNQADLIRYAFKRGIIPPE